MSFSCVWLRRRLSCETASTSTNFVERNVTQLNTKTTRIKLFKFMLFSSSGRTKKKKKNVRSSVTSFFSFGQKWLHVNVSSNCLWQRLGETFSISSMQNLFNWALFEEFRACSFTTPSSILIGFRSQLRLNVSSFPDIVLWIIILLESSHLQLWLLSRWPRVLHTHVLIWWFDDLMTRSEALKQPCHVLHWVRGSSGWTQTLVFS